MQSNGTVPLRLAVLKTGFPVPEVEAKEGPFAKMFRDRIITDKLLSDVVVDEIDLMNAALDDPDPALAAFDGVIMSGSASMLDEELPWMHRAIRIAKTLAHSDTPFLGVCFGHQVLGRAMEADVGNNARGRRMGTVEVNRSKSDPLFDNMPQSFPAQVSHVDVIRSAGPHLEVVGTSPHDPCHMVRFGDSTWGVQFHPEFSRWTVGHYLKARGDIVDAELGAGTAAKWTDALVETPEATALLAHFAHLCDARRKSEAA